MRGHVNVSNCFRQTCKRFKGIICPKMKNLWSFTHPHVIPKMYFFGNVTFFLLKYIKYIYFRNSGNQIVLVTTELHCMKKYQNIFFWVNYPFKSVDRILSPRPKNSFSKFITGRKNHHWDESRISPEKVSNKHRAHRRKFPGNRAQCLLRTSTMSPLLSSTRL